MGSITPYETSAGKRYRVRYHNLDRSQTDKRGFRTKRDAELFLAATEAHKATGEIAPRPDTRRCIFRYLSGREYKSGAANAGTCLHCDDS